MMRCPFCNEEIADGIKVCPHCNALVDQARLPLPEETGEKKKGKRKWIALGAAAAAVCGIGAAAVMMNAKSPKEKVIDAFEQAFSAESRALPGEEIFGWSQLVRMMGSEDIQEGVALTLSDSSVPELDPFRGSGLKLAAKSSPSAQKRAFEMGLVFSGMDLVDLDAYYGEENLLFSIPQLSSKVFLFDVSDGLAERLEASPFFGPAMEQYGYDVEAYAALLEQASKQAAGAGGGAQPFDIKALMDRYREGCQAKAGFQEALIVEKGEKKSFTVDGQEKDCQGYDMLVPKDALIAFLRGSADFLLQDETFRDDFVRQLQMAADLDAAMGKRFAMGSPKEQAAETYADMEEQVDALIDRFDQSMSDVDMEVYLTKKGELASVSWTTAITHEDETVDVTFRLELKGGAYPLQDMEAEIDLSSGEDRILLELLRSGTYDDTMLTDAVSIDLDVLGESFGGTYTLTYHIQDGSFHIQVEGRSDQTKAGAVSLTGTVDKLEKGKAFHADLEELRMEGIFEGQYITLTGEVYVEPLEGEIEAPSGETFDIVRAGQMEWIGVAMEIMNKGGALMGSLGIE